MVYQKVIDRKMQNPRTVNDEKNALPNKSEDNEHQFVVPWAMGPYCPVDNRKTEKTEVWVLESQIADRKILKKS